MQNDKPPNATRIANKLGPPPRTWFFFSSYMTQKVKILCEGIRFDNYKIERPKKKGRVDLFFIYYLKGNIWCIKNCNKHSSKTLLRLASDLSRKGIFSYILLTPLKPWFLFLGCINQLCICFCKGHKIFVPNYDYTAMACNYKMLTNFMLAFAAVKNNLAFFLKNV